MEQLKPKSLTFLLSSWLTISLIFLSGEIVTRYGAFGGLVIVLAFMLALLCFIPLLKINLETELPGLHAFLLLLWLLESLLVHLFIGSMLLHIAFQLDIYEAILVSSVIFMVVSILLYKLDDFVSGFQLVKLTIIFGLAILLPNYVYLQKGLETVYHNLLHYHPRILHLEQEGLNYLFLFALVIFFAKFFLQSADLKLVIGEFSKKGIQKLFLGAVIWSTIILAFSTMTVVATTQALPFEHHNELMIQLIKKLSTPFIFYLVIFALYSGTLVTVSLFFQSYYRKVNMKDKPLLNKMSLFFILALIPLFVAAFYPYLTILAIFYWAGGILAGLTILHILLSMVRKCYKEMTKR